MTQRESRDERAAQSVRESARRELAREMQRIALDPDGTGAGADVGVGPVTSPSSVPASAPLPPAGAKRTVPAPHGAPKPAAARPCEGPADPGMGRGGAPWGAAEDDGDSGRAARRAAFDQMFDRKYPELARARQAPPQRPAPAPQRPPDPVLQPRQLTAARLLLAGWRVTAVAARLGVDRHTLADWMKDPAFQREVRRMAVALPPDELLAGQ